MEKLTTLGKAARGAIAAVVLVFSAATVGAQMEAPKGVWTLAGFGIRTYWWGIVPTGGDFAALYDGVRIIPGVDTIVENDLGAGYETDNFYTNKDGSPYWGPSGDGSPVLYDRLEILEGLGIRQGILWDAKRNRNLLEGFLFYRLHYDRSYPGTGALVSASAFPDRDQILSNSIQTGASASTLEWDDVHKTWDGLYGEASVQWAPAFFINGIGSSDFYRLNVTLKGFRTLYAAPAKGEANFFSLYVGDFISVDYAGGDSIPFYVLESTGGLDPRATTDDWVRGFETGSYGTTFKAVNNFDIRIQGPAVIWPSLVPGLYAFTDAGCYSGFYKDPTSTPGGFLVSVGTGGYLDFFDLANVTAYIAFPLYGHRVDSAPYEISFHFKLDF
jgi:hypothetical protein